MNIGNRTPVALFGGRDHAAAIDSEGQIIFLPNLGNANISNPIIKFFSLPNNEQTTSIGCCNEYVFAVSSNGQTFRFSTNDFIFNKILELSNEEIIDVSAKADHCFALSKEGKVFVYGGSYNSSLCLGKGIFEISKFPEILDSRNHKITSVFTCSTHSLFTASVGNNQNGELFLNKPSSNEVYSFVDTTIKGGDSFCIGGVSLSIAFIGETPQNIPNKRITALDIRAH